MAEASLPRTVTWGEAHDGLASGAQNLGAPALGCCCYGDLSLCLVAKGRPRPCGWRMGLGTLHLGSWPAVWLPPWLIKMLIAHRNVTALRKE